MLSIALALSIITSALPRGQMFKIFSGTAGHGMSAAAAASFMSGFHEALLVGAAASLIGAAFSALRGKSVIMAPFTRESHHAWRSSLSRSDHAPLLTSGRSGAHDK
jgi:hypothetical protein